jgi:hypothetical protein
MVAHKGMPVEEKRIDKRRISWRKPSLRASPIILDFNSSLKILAAQKEETENPTRRDLRSEKSWIVPALAAIGVKPASSVNRLLAYSLGAKSKPSLGQVQTVLCARREALAGQEDTRDF